MKKQDKQKYQQMEVAQLLQEVEKLRLELAKTILKKQARKLSDIKMVGKIKDQIAVIKTYIKEKQQEQSVS